MKKILGALVCALTLFGASVQAEAAAIDWSYEIASATVSTTNDNVTIFGDLTPENGLRDGNTAIWNDDNSLSIPKNIENSPVFGRLDIQTDLSTPSSSNYEELFSVTFAIDFTINGNSFTSPLTIDFYSFYSGNTEYLTYNLRNDGAPLAVFDNIEYTLSSDSGVILTSLSTGLPADTTQPTGADGPSWNITGDTYNISLSLTPTATPEPATMLLMGLGLAGLGLVARRRK